MNLKQKAFKGLLWSIVQNSGSQVFSLFIFLVLARLLTPETFGLIALANVFLAFMQIFRQQGFAKALIQRENIEPEHLDAAFWSQVGFGILLMGVTFFSADLVANIFDQPKLISILKCLSLLFVINSFSHVHNAILEREFAFKIIALRSLLATIISGIVGISMAFAGYGVWSLVALNITLELVSLVVMWSEVDWRPKLRFSLKHFQDLFSFGMYVLAFKFIKFFDKRADNLLIGYFLGEVALGYYAIAYRILEIMTQLLVKTTNKVALPTFSRLQKDPERFRQLFYKTTQFTSIIAFPTYLGVVVFAPELTVTLFGEQWIPSIGAMQILALEGIVLSLSHFHKSVFVSMGKPSWTVKVSLFNAAANLIACLIAVRWGIIAVAAGYVISSYLVFPVSQWAVNKFIKIKLMNYLRRFVTPLASSGIMVVAILIVKHFLLDVINLPLLIIVGTSMGMLVYALCIKFFEPQLYEQLWNFVNLTTSGKK
ncbi:Polysaccharide biosynthesis family protein [Hyella patelloides LEGE 07179]|uniref:Polysaccharide biosynthesis family protein n=1 Tax=Hyella patelloides LEGE 07179 TaxID=945734 RepID=A0A563VQU6_9CYAN|nr:lipopolysaccharide biosynthesis protein [Hyella patelloides]VEP13838.1 Polysaccharide biosynthesis family protein [Hyella patelloides LEGE 07179]